MLSNQRSSHLGNFIFAIALTAALPVTAAHAYVDGGSVTMAAQVLIGGIASALMFAKLYLRRIFAFFRSFGRSAASETAKD